MKTDTTLYEIFSLFPNLVLELIGEPVLQANAYRFESVEIKQAAFRLDGLLIPDQPEQPIYFVECQFQKDDLFYLRFIGEIGLYLHKKKYLGRWRAVVLFARESLDPGLTPEYQIFEDNGYLQRLYLQSIKDEPGSLKLNILQLVAVSKPQMRKRVKQVVNRVEVEVSEQIERDQILELLATLLMCKYPSQSRRELEMAFGLKEIRKTKVFQEARDEGKLEGKAEGEQIGKLEGKLEAVPSLVKEGLSVEKIAHILNLTVEQVTSVLA